MYGGEKSSQEDKGIIGVMNLQKNMIFYHTISESKVNIDILLSVLPKFLANFSFAPNQETQIKTRRNLEMDASPDDGSRDDDSPPPDEATNHQHQAGEEAARIETARHLVSEAHRRLVNDVQEAMTPANCRKENRSLSTRLKNMYESCRLVAWLAGIANNENTETKRRLKGLIDDRLVLDIELAVDSIVGAKTVPKVAKSTRASIRQWLEVDDGPAPFAFAGFGYDDYSNYLRSQLRRSDGAPLKQGKCYKNKRSNLNNLFERFKYQPTMEFQEKVDAYLDGDVRIVASAAQSGIGSIVSGKRVCRSNCTNVSWFGF